MVSLMLPPGTVSLLFADLWTCFCVDMVCGKKVCAVGILEKC